MVIFVQNLKYFKYIKLKIFILCVVFSLFNALCVLAQDLEPFISADNIIRVGISSNDFKKLEYENIAIGSSQDYKLIDKNSGSIIANLKPYETVKFSMKYSKFTVTKGTVVIAKNITGPIGVITTKNGRLKIIGLKRKGLQATYRGEFEIIRAPGWKHLFSVVNVLPLEDYLKGVVPNEIPVSFGLEAVKAQAIAARNYAIRPRVKYYPQFDLCDSVQSQVYFGANTEKALSSQAVEQTKGLFSLYKGDVITALYCSTSGGFTESYENAFSETGTCNFPSQSIPYLVGKPDLKEIGNLDTEEKVRTFYEANPKSFDVNSRYYRWIKTWTVKEFESVLNRTLANYSKTGFITPEFNKNDNFGILKDIKVLRRGLSGKAMFVELTSDKGKWVVSKELVIRRVLQKNNISLPSANIIIDLSKSSDGKITQITIKGGGFGHGVGMSQYGAGFMAQNDYTFDQILQHYYSNTAIGTWPVLMISKVNKQPKLQVFNSPIGQAELVIQCEDNIEEFKIQVNSKTIHLKKEDLKESVENGTEFRLGITPYVLKGVNEIVYFPPLDDEEGKMLKVWVEVYKEKNE